MVSVGRVVHARPQRGWDVLADDNTEVTESEPVTEEGAVSGPGKLVPSTVRAPVTP